MARQKALNFPPGEEHLYSNSGYFLLSVIVKRASGKSLRDFAEERIFGPLGMTHTQFNDSHTLIIPNRATGYSRPKDGGFGIDMSDWEQTGDGAVLTTVEDLARWDQNFYDAKVGGATLIEALHAVGVLDNGKEIDYAAALYVDTYRGLPASATAARGPATARSSCASPNSIFRSRACATTAARRIPAGSPRRSRRSTWASSWRRRTRRKPRTGGPAPAPPEASAWPGPTGTRPTARSLITLRRTAIWSPTCDGDGLQLSSPAAEPLPG